MSFIKGYQAAENMFQGNRRNAASSFNQFRAQYPNATYQELAQMRDQLAGGDAFVQQGMPSDEILRRHADIQNTRQQQIQRANALQARTTERTFQQNLEKTVGEIALDYENDADIEDRVTEFFSTGDPNADYQVREHLRSRYPSGFGNIRQRSVNEIVRRNLPGAINLIKENPNVDIRSFYPNLPESALKPLYEQANNTFRRTQLVNSTADYNKSLDSMTTHINAGGDPLQLENTLQIPEEQFKKIQKLGAGMAQKRDATADFTQKKRDTTLEAEEQRLDSIKESRTREDYQRQQLALQQVLKQGLETNTLADRYAQLGFDGLLKAAKTAIDLPPGQELDADLVQDFKGKLESALQNNQKVRSTPTKDALLKKVDFRIQESNTNVASIMDYMNESKDIDYHTSSNLGSILNEIAKEYLVDGNLKKYLIQKFQDPKMIELANDPRNKISAVAQSIKEDPVFKKMAIDAGSISEERESIRKLMTPKTIDAFHTSFKDRISRLNDEANKAYSKLQEQLLSGKGGAPMHKVIIEHKAAFNALRAASLSDLEDAYSVREHWVDRYSPGQRKAEFTESDVDYLAREMNKSYAIIERRFNELAASALKEVRSPDDVIERQAKEATTPRDKQPKNWIEQKIHDTIYGVVDVMTESGPIPEERKNQFLKEEDMLQKMQSLRQESK